MPFLYLHAGAPKTGTSYLQVLFAKYAQQLAQHGIVYPRGHLFDQAMAGEITSGNGVEMANYIRPHLPHKISHKEAFIRELERQLAEGSGKSILYSSEFLVFDAGARTASIANVAAKHGYKVRVIYLIRDIAPAAFSVYAQQVKNHGEVRTFADFITDWDPHYRSSIQKAVDGFGRESMLVYNFEEHKGRLAELFFSDILGVGFVPDDRTKVNRSLSLREAEMVRVMNTVRPKDARFSAFVSRALMSIEGDDEEFSATRDEVGILTKRFSAAVEYVNDFVCGERSGIARNVIDERSSIQLAPFERSMMAIVASLVSSVTKQNS